MYWHHLAEKALSRYKCGLLPQQLDPHNILNRVPTIPTEPVNSHKLSFDDSTKTALFLEAHSTFRVAKDEGCGVGDKIKTIPALLLLGVKSPTPLAWTGTSFYQWVGIEGENNSARNFISILALGWSYILSARLLEMQGQGSAGIVYTQSTATGYNHDTGDRAAATITIDIGDVDEDAARWWAAILAPDQGWKAVVSQDDHEVYLSPWSVCVGDEQRIGLDWRTNPLLSQDSTVSTPPSSKKAFELLTGFCLLHDLGSQFFAALATTLTFPTHNHYGTVAKLPFPTSMRGPGEHTPAKFTMPGSAKLGEELPYYMALSCNHSVIVSSLCGVFWEPNVPCNLVSPWLHPVMNEVPIMEEIMSFKGRYEEILAIMCAIRRPRLSALWLGAVISGLAPTVLDFVRSGTPPLDPNAFAWTGCAQSFMDLAGSGPYSRTEASGEKLQKADAWRLLFLPTVVDDDLHYESYPFAPWKPIGTTSVQNSVARIRIHMSCSRHHLDYQHWTWQLGDGSTLDDEGLEMKPVQTFSQEVSPPNERTASAKCPTVALSLHQEASRKASWEIFQWVTANGEGVPGAEPIYKDEWLRDDAVSETSSSPIDVETDSTFGLLSPSSVATDGDQMVSAKDATGIISPAPKLDMESWLNGLALGGF